MTKTLWFKLKSRFCRQGRSQRETVNGLPSKISVNEEYLGAFRTKSYIEISDRVQKQLETTASTRNSSRTSTHPSEYLIDPRQETLKSSLESFNLDHLLLEYFDASEEAYDICETLLRGVNKTRRYYCEIRRVIKLSKRAYNHPHFSAIIGELASLSVLENPLSIITPLQFRENHDGYLLLLEKLGSKGRKIRRKLAIKKLLKQIGGISLIISNTALLIVLLFFAFHSLVGIVAVPALAACFIGMMEKTKKMKWPSSKVFKTTESLEKLREQLDHASKGIYIMINDFDTLSRMAMRLQDEVDHWKAIAEMCVKNGKYELLKEAVKEFQVHDSSFLEQLEELEQHIFLCYLTMNRSRGLILQAIMAANQPKRW